MIEAVGELRESSAARHVARRILPLIAIAALWILPMFIRIPKSWTAALLAKAGSQIFAFAGLAEIVLPLLFLGATLAIVRFWERLPFSSIGLKRVTLTEIGIGVGVLLAAWAATWLNFAAYWLIFHNLPVEPYQLRLGLLAEMPLGLLLLLFAVGVAGEELVTRGYAIERIQGLGIGAIAAAAISLGINLGMHIPFWGWRYPIFIWPAQLVLTLTYLWRRSLTPGITAHFLYDSGMVLVLALIPSPGFPHVSALTALKANFFVANGKAFEDKREHDRAIANFSAAIALMPNDGDAYDWRGFIYWRKGEYDSALSDFSKALKIDSKDYYAYERRADIYSTEGDLDRAIDDYTAAIKLDQVSPPYAERAQTLARRGDHDRAISDFDQAIDLEPNESFNYEQRGTEWFAKHQYDRAIADFSKVIALDPDQAEAFNSRAQAYLAQRDYAHALADLGTAISLDPDPYAYVNRAEAFIRAGRYSDARTDFETAIHLGQNDEDTLNDAAWLLSTCPVASVRDGRRARELALASSDVTEWNDPQILDTAAAAFAESGDFSDAIALEDLAIARGDEDLGTPKHSIGVYRAHLRSFERREPLRDSSMLGLLAR